MFTTLTRRSFTFMYYYFVWFLVNLNKLLAHHQEELRILQVVRITQCGNSFRCWRLGQIFIQLYHLGNFTFIKILETALVIDNLHQRCNWTKRPSTFGLITEKLSVRIFILPGHGTYWARVRCISCVTPLVSLGYECYFFLGWCDKSSFFIMLGICG